MTYDPKHYLTSGYSFDLPSHLADQLQQTSNSPERQAMLTRIYKNLNREAKARCNQLLKA